MKTTLDRNPRAMCLVNDGGIITIVAPQNRLRISDIQSIFRSVLSYAELGHRDIILDFSRVERVCITTLGLLSVLDAHLRERGGSLKLAEVPRQLWQLMRMFHVENRFEVWDSTRQLKNVG